MAMKWLCFKIVAFCTMNEVSSGSARDPEGSINVSFNLGHKVDDGTFFDVILLVMFDP